MKKIFEVVILLTAVFPMSLFAHPGHDHSGAFWDNVIHFMITNGYLLVAVLVSGYLLFRYGKIAYKVKSSAK